MAYEEDDEQIDVVRHHNRVQRRVNSSLRRALKYSVEYNDNLFMELCNSDSDKEAKLAMEKLWTLGKFQCGPQDYDFIVEMCIRALEDSETLSHRPEAAMQMTRKRQTAS